MSKEPAPHKSSKRASELINTGAKSTNVDTENISMEALTRTPKRLLNIDDVATESCKAFEESMEAASSALFSTFKRIKDIVGKY